MFHFEGYPVKLTQIKEFQFTYIQGYPPYRFQNVLIEEKMVPCINVKPYENQDLLMTLPDFLKYCHSNVAMKKAKKVLLDILKIVFYSGNSGHKQVLQSEGKCNGNNTVPLVLVKDIRIFFNSNMVNK